MLQNYKILISYDGTDFHGWQRQSHKPTIQGIIEDSLLKITKNRISITGAGRTDAGVHAQGQIANFKADIRLNENELFFALNSHLPGSIRINSVEKVNHEFHSIKMAKSKIYQYRIFNSPYMSPFIHRYVYQWNSPLDIESMKKGACLFIREDDFSAFSSNRLLYPVRKVTISDIQKNEDEIIYTVEANGFLRYMVRSMVGTLLEIGRGKVKPDIIDQLFREKKRTLSSPTAPAKGLCLIKVNL